jgi:hypothetical protein
MENTTELQKLYDRLHELKAERDLLLGVDDIDSLSYEDKITCSDILDMIDEVYEEISDLEGIDGDVFNLIDDNDEGSIYPFEIDNEIEPGHYYDNDQDFEIDTDF